MGPVPPPLKRFLWDLSSLIDMAEGDEREIVTVGVDLMRRFIEAPDWLPADFAAGHSDGPCHYQLYEDPAERFFIFSEVWLPGQAGPVIDHGVWGFLGVLRGTEQRRRFGADGAPLGEAALWQAGSVETLTRRTGLITQSAHGGADGATVGIRVFGGPHLFSTDRANAPDRPGWDIYTLS